METLRILQQKLRQIARGYPLLGDLVAVSAGPLSPQEAIGNPHRQDYPLLQGQEVLIEADSRGAKGQAFTDSPQEFHGHLDQALRLPLTKNTERAIFIATLNAVMRSLGYAEGTRHCRDKGPEIRAVDIAYFLAHHSRGSNVALIGLQPAILEALVQQFGASHVRATDRNPKNVGAVRWG